MKRVLNVAWLLCLVSGLALVAPASVMAQTVTTGSLSGVVNDQQGGALPGVTVTATHVATGSTYSGVTTGEGRFSLLNTRIGVYIVKVTLSGFKDAEQKDVVVSLGEDTPLTFSLILATVSETVTVTAEAPPINLAEGGTSANIANGIKENLPTINRSLFDIARVNPHFAQSGFNEDPLSISVAGRNNRYNSIQIDGAVNNDLFGLAASGTPGGQTETQPISLDAIAELQLVVSPYDVRQGGFSGGGLNAVTKHGTNNLHGTAFYFGRNQAWVGDNIDGRALSAFSDKQVGFSLGGPIRENKLFFFTTADWGRKSTPSGVSVSGSGVQFGREAEVDRFLSILKNRYGYDLGSSAKDEFTRTTNSDKFFIRGDVNLGRHQVTVRHNYVNGLNDIGSPSQTFYLMPDRFYHIGDKTNSTVGQINSRLGNAVNEFRVTFTTIRNKRGGQPVEPKPFPMVTVRNIPGSGSIVMVAGRENFSTANELDQDIIEINNDYTTVRGNHTITLGTHNEFFKFRNLFIRDNFGSYTFNSIDQFEQGFAQQYDYSFSATADPKQAARFSVNQLGFYIGDQWRVRRNVTMTSGLRVDIPIFPDKPTANPAAVSNFGYGTDVVPESTMWSPRVGFNWDLSGNGTEQIRGGIGMFAGRTPYVWLSNQYGNTGIEFTRIGATLATANNIPFVPDAANQPKVVTGAAGSSFTNEIDLVDPEYKFPSIVRGNIGYDRQLPWGLVATAELLFTSNVQEIDYQNLNLTQIGTQNIDSRPRYARQVTSLSDVIFLTNSNQGGAWSMTFELKRSYKNGWFASGSYLYGQSESVMDGTSSQAASNWGFAYTPGDPNHRPVARSDFDQGHRINFSTSYQFQIGGDYTVTASAFFNGQSGRPYTLTYSSDVNGDARTTNDLMYLPAATDPFTYTNGTYQDLAAFFNADQCRSSQVGKVFERNSCRGPWNNTLDGRVNVGLPFRKVKAEITLDILNMINVFNNDGGQFRYVSNNRMSFTPILTSGQITGMNLASLPTISQFTRSDLRSRWQLQLGGRVRF
jgi:Carboxypeptidase regulatory-like domain